MLDERARSGTETAPHGTSAGSRLWALISSLASSRMRLSSGPTGSSAATDESLPKWSKVQMVEAGLLTGAGGAAAPAAPAAAVSAAAVSAAVSAAVAAYSPHRASIERREKSPRS